MFGIGWAELVVIGVVALVVVGPDKLPEAARAVGKVYGYVYRALMEARESIKAEADLLDLDSQKEPKTAEPAKPAADDHKPDPPKDES